ncbi:MAG: hypothetical protein U9O87_10535, partial [Verrucomicrobiota bacterium]|nr:hypothetical protein [Verrucomicrobiota bacterium]
KQKYFDLLPDTSYLKDLYKKLLSMTPSAERDGLENKINSQMKPGTIDVNIMVKLDVLNFDKMGNSLAEEFSDAKAALRGYANSMLESGVVFSAGINQKLYSYMEKFQDFYRDATGNTKKKIILKVSDFRSAMIQGRFLAKKGLEVHEFRIESGLNCGGHAFPSDGILLPKILQEFKNNKHLLAKKFRPFVKKYYEKMNWEYPQETENSAPLITVQGGIGTHGELRRLTEDFDADCTGWATPFLLVPETTSLDQETFDLLKDSSAEDLYTSPSSPLNVPFNNIRGSGSEKDRRLRIEKGKPGSPCRQGFLKLNTEFTKQPICTASIQYQKLKLAEIEEMPISNDEKNSLKEKVLQKSCICHHLGNGTRMKLGITKKAPQAICPGPNLQWFNREFSLQEMTHHIQGQMDSVVSKERPHMFLAEVQIYVNYFEEEVKNCSGTESEIKRLTKIRKNLLESMDFCIEIANKKPYPQENLDSIKIGIPKEKERLEKLYKKI